MNDISLEKFLHRADYTLLRYQLRFVEDTSLPSYALLRLRREMNRIVKEQKGDSIRHAGMRTLLHPDLPVDPFVLRQVQQPAPGFIIQIDSFKAQKYVAGDLLSLPVCFFAKGMLLIEPFTRLLEALAPIGLHNKKGRFQLESIEEHSVLPQNKPLWAGGPFQVTPTITDLSWSQDGALPSSVKLEFLTPARLLKNSRPLFRPAFAEVFPFVLRRVSGMLSVWADLEDLFDVSYLLDCATKVDEAENCLGWQDWRPLQRNEEVGGLCGSVALSGQGLGAVMTVLRIGELFGIGKGAAFGAGRYRLL